jgi:hypothetical protein
MTQLINLTIINNSNCTLSIPLFSNNGSSINATTKYQWDVTTATISCGFGSIIVNGSLITLSFTPTLTSLVDSLNALGYGFFCTEVIGANTYIYTVDDTNTYGLLDLCPISTTTTTTTTTAAPTTSTTTTTTTVAPTTSTTTTTTTAAPIFTLSVTDGATACSGIPDWSGTATFSGGLNTLCSSTSVTITSNTGLFDTAVGNNGFFYLSDGINSRYYQRNGILFTALPQAACVAC